MSIDDVIKVIANAKIASPKDIDIHVPALPLEQRRLLTYGYRKHL
jgi:hypothetical protein